MDLILGMAFRCMAEPRHIYVPLFDPSRDADEMLFVNFTTLRDRWVDDVCILDEKDYAELKHRTTVAYSRANIYKKSMFCAAVANNHFVRLDDLPGETLKKIISGALASNELPERKKGILPKSF
jgi:hypothetical protein